jgi:hypothetical protein
MAIVIVASVFALRNQSAQTQPLMINQSALSRNEGRGRCT